MNDAPRQYRRAAHYNVTHRRRQNFYALPTAQWQMLAAAPFNLLAKFDRVDDAIDANADIASSILESGLGAFGLDSKPTEPSMDWRGTAKPSDMDKARTTIRQLYRDWSAEGLVERRRSYEPVLADLLRLFPMQDKGSVKLLVPGSGLGRLAFEICRLGFDTEGNEISYHQLIASNWVLNLVSEHQQFDLYPFALTFSNHISREHQLKCVRVPDVHPGTLLDSASRGMKTHAFERMGMTAADFVVLYGDARYSESFDAVATVFFLDTAPNVLQYLRVIRNCLKVGGYWINLGPLLWHFEEHSHPSSKPGNQRRISEDSNVRTDRQEDYRTTRNEGIGEPGSVELTVEELLLLVERMGFSIERHGTEEDCGYIQDAESMIQNTYRVAHWVARKSI